MDATANQHRVYEIHGDSHVLMAPKGSRRYNNVTLWVSCGHNVGKNTLSDVLPKKVRNHCQALLGELSDRLEVNPAVP